MADDQKELPPQTSGKAWAAGVAGVAATVGSIVLLIPETVRNAMTFEQWAIAIGGSFVLCFAGAWFTKNYAK